MRPPIHVSSERWLRFGWAFWWVFLQLCIFLALEVGSWLFGAFFVLR
jgi:hypothetical protein